jgi:site-specific DNA-methyltransferase (adenine-specific)
MNITNEDNMELMSRYKDNYFDLAIVDPPYGIDLKMQKFTKPSRPNSYINKPKHKGFNDNKRPSKKYFKELKRVSKNQIIWGGQYFCDLLAISGSWIFWNKMNGEGSHFADGELAYTTFTKSLKMFSVSSFHNTRGGKDRIHPTQKPVKLYEWLLINYAKEGDKILDTHLGSGSIAIACHNLGYDLTACELDKEYFDAAIERIEQHTQQVRMF